MPVILQIVTNIHHKSHIVKTSIPWQYSFSQFGAESCRFAWALGRSRSLWRSLSLVPIESPCATSY